MARRDNMHPMSGQELKSDDTVLDVAAWREAMQTALEAVQAAPSAIYSGQKTIAAAGTEEAIGSPQALTRGVWVRAHSTNTNNVFVGPNPVTSSTGYILSPGQAVFIAVANVATVYLDVTTNGEGVSWIAS